MPQGAQDLAGDVMLLQAICKENADDDFTIRSRAEMMETMSSTMDSITIILVVAAAFSLLVAFGYIPAKKAASLDPIEAT